MWGLRGNTDADTSSLIFRGIIIYWLCKIKHWSKIHDTLSKLLWKKISLKNTKWENNKGNIMFMVLCNKGIFK